MKEEKSDRQLQIIARDTHLSKLGENQHKDPGRGRGKKRRNFGIQFPSINRLPKFEMECKRY